MKMPDQLLQLLEELSARAEDSSVVTVDSSCALITLEDHPDPIRLNASECELLLHSQETVERLFEALNATSAAIELRRLRLSAEAETALSLLFDEVL